MNIYYYWVKLIKYILLLINPETVVLYRPIPVDLAAVLNKLTVNLINK